MKQNEKMKSLKVKEGKNTWELTAAWHLHNTDQSECGTEPEKRYPTRTQDQSHKHTHTHSTKTHTTLDVYAHTHLKRGVDSTDQRVQDVDTVMAMCEDEDEEGLEEGGLTYAPQEQLQIGGRCHHFLQSQLSNEHWVHRDQSESREIRLTPFLGAGQRWEESTRQR